MYFELLIAKLYTEQQMYKKWLAAQTPDEILRHAREYSVRERILDCLTNDMVEYVITEEQAKALLDVQSPFKEIYNAFSQYDDMDEIHETIEYIANEKIKESLKLSKPVTEIEKELDGIRITPQYQEILKLVKEIEYDQDYSREKMIQVCKYSGSLPGKENYDLLSDDLLENMFMHEKENILTPYIISGVEYSFEPDRCEYIGHYETIEEAFKAADIFWDENVRGTLKYDKISIISIAHDYREYVTFSCAYHFLDNLRTIMKLEERIDGNIKPKWFIQLFGVLAAYDESFCTAFEEVVSDDALSYLKSLAKI